MDNYTNVIELNNVVKDYGDFMRNWFIHILHFFLII